MEPLMNMLISRRAERGERASPVLFLHSSDERGGKKRDGKDGAGERNGGEAKKERVASIEKGK